MDKKSKKVPEDLIGFKEFIEYEEKKSPSLKGRVNGSNFDLLSFLENESIRLSKTIDLCEEQSYHLKKYSQVPPILSKQEQIINKNRQILMELLSRKDSPLTKNLKELLHIHFSQ